MGLVNLGEMELGLAPSSCCSWFLYRGEFQLLQRWTLRLQVRLVGFLHWLFRVVSISPKRGLCKIMEVKGLLPLYCSSVCICSLSRMNLKSSSASLPRARYFASDHKLGWGDSLAAIVGSNLPISRAIVSSIAISPKEAASRDDFSSWSGIWAAWSYPSQEAELLS